MLLLLALIASPALHHALHPDSHHADHECLVTVFAKGQVNQVEIIPVLGVVALFVMYVLARPAFSPPVQFAYRFARGRAPPCL